MLVRLVLVILMAILLTGCVSPLASKSNGPGRDAAKLACRQGACDVQVTTSPATRQANELSVAVNPLDPLNIIATGKDYTPDQAGQCVWAGIYTTKDGGVTWKNANLAGSPWKRMSDPTQGDTPFSKFWCATDPVVRFGPDGTAYWAVMPYQCDPGSGSKTGEGVLPFGGLNDFAFTCSAMYILVSTDGGMTWPLSKAREIGTGPSLVHDKEWIAVAPDAKTLLYCWDYTGQGSTAADGSAVPPAPAGVAAGVVCSQSKDKGDSWSRFSFVTDKGGAPAVDYDGTGRAWMVVTGGDADGAKHYVLSSTDGVKWSEPVQAATAKDPSSQNEHGRAVLNGSAFRVASFGSLGVDRSAGKFGGRVYLTYFDHAAGNGETMLVWSQDGKTWSKPARVNDDDGGADQFLPAVSVGPDGTVDVSWQDRRDDPANHLFTTYYAYSTDGGVTFSKNLRVASAQSDEKYSHHQNGDVFLGDYRDMSSTKGRATMVWVDTRNSKADVFLATVERPGAGTSR